MDGEWREVRKRGVGLSLSESKPVRHQKNPNPRIQKTFRRRVDVGYGAAANWNQRGSTGNRGRSEDVGGKTFFFNNIPDDCSVDFLKRKFETVMETADVFCPKKRDLKGKPFGFVRFSNVEYEAQLLADLNELWIGNYKRVFKPRFRRDREKVGNMELERAAGDRKDQVRYTPKTTSNRKIGVSYMEVLTGKKAQEPLVDEILQFEPFDSEKDRLRGAFTGYIKPEFIWEDIREELNSECVGRLRVTSLGGNLVIIQSTWEAQVENVLADLNEWCSFWFQWFRSWRYVDVNYQRIVWTRWLGVPLHAWNPRFFDVACAKIGMVLKIEESTRSRERLDEAFIQISTGLKTIDRMLQCRIG